MALGILAVIVMIGALVFIHEFGHFVVAKLFGVGVPVFSIGMGPRLFGFVYKGTDYRVSALPVGGYVQLAGADPFGDYDPDARFDPDEDFTKKPVWQRLLVMAAGPVANLILPLVLFTAVLMGGEPQADTTIGSVLAGSPMEDIGLEDGDRIVAVAGEPVEVWADLAFALADHVGSDVELTIDRAGAGTHTVLLPGAAIGLVGPGLVDTDAMGFGWQPRSSRVGVDDPASPAWRAGLRTGDLIEAVDGLPVDTWNELQAALVGERHELTVLRATRRSDGTVDTSSLDLSVSAEPTWQPRPGDVVADRLGLVPAALYVGEVSPGTPAEKAGIRWDDRLLAIDGVAVRDWTHLVQLIAATLPPEPASLPRALTIDLVREGAVVQLTVTPAVVDELVLAEPRRRPALGIGQYPDAYVSGTTVVKYYSLLEAVPRAAEETVLLIRGTLSVLAGVATFEIKPQDAFGGPVKIAQIAAEGAREGIFTFVRRAGMISISLGIINLLPVPVLDGGQITIYLLEALRGRPLSVALRERLQMIGVLMLVALMLLVTVFDVGDLFGG